MSILKTIFFKPEKETENLFVKWFNIILVTILVLGIFHFAFSSIDYPYNWKGIIEKYRYKFLLGFKMTLLISVFSLVSSFLIGTLLVLGQRGRFLPTYYFAKGFTEMIRGTPLIVQIYLFYYVIGTAFGINNRYVMGILIMGVFSGAYVCEILRGGIESIDKSQLETAKALAFTKAQTYRYIILPQVIKRVMPPLAGQFASLIKDSSLLSIIAVNEFTKNVQEVDSLTFSPIENYCILAVGYLILTYPISHLSKYLERRYNYGN
ncbi:amino acid ABC transporter permease [uncultured Cetobacterium sp.]|uniref:amino acid ABC transporter permease n=1 Tax=uncultured Cetobacterium sp. TaxID=527638 RepID=UPI0025E3CF5A|nr:amino acid ABC transporter permease [uncultured Cetobacterium sp.]